MIRLFFLDIIKSLLNFTILLPTQPNYIIQTKLFFTPDGLNLMVLYRVYNTKKPSFNDIIMSPINY